MFSAMVLTSIVKVPYDKRLCIFMVSGIIFSIGFAAFTMVNFKYMLFFLFIAGFFLAILNTFISASLQLTVPQNMRGKVFSIKQTLVGGLTPIAMATIRYLFVVVDIEKNSQPSTNNENQKKVK
ncbi:hypothetical protein [Clostridium estertheticum]|uniref:hypothetical protein n=1 Tax=Clostridium estertheticum TaxID=238834 RepID=UPI001C7D40FA|nr:hypothetical protein [Clostridium estertheticum]MBX4270343.1 hypothetical protein [Clostridium estertheticum]WLC80882.1 hypothetical protein KTC98_06505 [Clostridium estertheticum]